MCWRSCLAPLSQEAVEINPGSWDKLTAASLHLGRLVIHCYFDELGRLFLIAIELDILADGTSSFRSQIYILHVLVSYSPV